jgi:hypothetical protein
MGICNPSNATNLVALVEWLADHLRLLLSGEPISNTDLANVEEALWDWLRGEA